MTYIVGYDGSAASDAAVRFARLLAATTGTEVLAAGVYPTIPHPLAPGATAMADAEVSQELRAETERRLAGLGDGVAHAVVAAQSAAEGLHRLADEHDAALLAVGVTHRGAVGRLVPGGVGDRLLHGAPCPVAVVPPTWTERPCTRIAVAYDGRDESQVALRAAEDLARRLEGRVDLLGVYDPAPYLWLTSTAPAPTLWDVPELHEGFDDEVRTALEGVDAAVRGEARTVSGIPGPATSSTTPPARCS